MAEASEFFKDYHGKMGELKCDICSKYLSISPILYNQTVGRVCGRCYKNKETENFDGDLEFQFQDVFEIVAKYFKFPCSFDVNGCNQMLEWDDVEKHENDCEFKGVLCPLHQTEFVQIQDGRRVCEWMGCGNEFFPHMLEDHEEIFTAELILKIDPSKHYVSRIAMSKVLESNVLLMMLYKEKLERHFCDVRMDIRFSDTQRYKFDLELSGENDSRSVILPNNSVTPNHHRIFSGPDQENSLEVDIRSVYKLLGKPEIITLFCKIYRVSEKGEIILPINLKKSETTEIKLMKCKCGNQLVPPIYVCSTGHNFCSKCKSRSSYCETCNSSFLPGQNTALETVISLSLFQCKNYLKGCSVKLESKQLDFHQNNCSLTEKICILNCGWKGSNADMYIHIKNAHTIYYINQVYEYGSATKVYPILFDDNIFILTIDYKINAPTSIHLQCLGMQEGQYSYKFTIYSSNNNMKLATHHLCQPLCYDETGKEITTPKVVLPFEFLRQFITDYRGFDYKIRIKKN